jgi:hypothetical protein
LKFDYTENKGFSYIAEYSFFIKIYTKEGLSWASYAIPFYVGYKEQQNDRIEITKANVYNLVNGRIDREKVTGDGNLSNKINENWATKIVNFPNVRKGSIIELQYTLYSEDINSIEAFTFQSDIPVKSAKLQTKIPGFFEYRIIKSGIYNFTISEDFKEGFINFSKDVGDRGARITNSMVFKNWITTFTLEDIPAFIEEPFQTNKDDCYAAISLELVKVQYGDDEPQIISSNWEDVAKTVYNQKSFGLELEKFDYFLEDLKRIVSSSTDTKERSLAVFNWLRRRMNWNKQKGIFASKPLEQAYADKTGSVADINLMLVAMLRMAGVEANPVLLTTHEKGAPNFPNYSKFNYVIAGVQIGSEQLLLDATHKAGETTLLPLITLNGSGRMIKKNGESQEINLVPSNFSEIKNIVLITLLDDTRMEGKVKNYYKDYAAVSILTQAAGINKDQMEEVREKEIRSIQLENYSLNETDERTALEMFTFSSKNFVEQLGNKVFINPLVYLAQMRNPFLAETRTFPIRFSYPRRYTSTVIITIPEMYKVVALPEAAAYTMSNNRMNYRYQIQSEEGKVTVATTLEINQVDFPVESYDTLKEFFKLAVDKELEKILLEKK